MIKIEAVETETDLKPEHVVDNMSDANTQPSTINQDNETKKTEGDRTSQSADRASRFPQNQQLQAPQNLRVSQRDKSEIKIE